MPLSSQQIHHLELHGIVMPGVQAGSTFHPSSLFEAPCVVTKSIRYDTAVSVGAFSMVHGPGECVGVSIGRYCSIAPYAVLGANEHSIDWLSTSSLLENPNLFGWSKLTQIVPEQTAELKGTPFADSIRPIVIGHDVWIGQSAFVRGRVTIGNGAVVAAGSIVTRDVEPYSIVAGNPARHVRYRFDERTIEQLELLKWWEYSAFDLIPLGLNNVESAIEKISEAISKEVIQPYQSKSFDGNWLNGAST